MSMNPTLDYDRGEGDGQTSEGVVPVANAESSVASSPNIQNYPVNGVIVNNVFDVQNPKATVGNERKRGTQAVLTTADRGDPHSAQDWSRVMNESLF